MPTAEIESGVDRTGTMDRKELVELAKRMDIDEPCANSQSVEIPNFVRSVALVSRTSSLPSRRARARDYIRRLQKIIEESPQTPLTLADLAQLLNLERTYCCKVFRELTGVHFSEWMRRIRIASAQSMLRHSAHSITEVAHAVGYDDITTFARNFRKEVGLSPRSFRRLSLQSFY